MKEKAHKNCCIRLPESLHRQAKLQAFKEGKNLQNWVAELISIKLASRESNSKWLCQECGGWTLKGTQLAMLGKCESCGKEVPVFPVWEKK
jgi:predicted RNA-binding Zn-ribbon protein involved in translation (DUF1610 family)